MAHGPLDHFCMPGAPRSHSLTGRTHAEAEASILWPPDMKSQLVRKDPDAGED